MDKAFELATRKMEEWVTKYPNSYPPVVLNISGGVPNDPEAAEHAAQALRQVSTSDGDALLYNCCFSQWGFPIEFPNYEEVLPDIVSKWFFRISSEIPEPVAADARFCGYQQVLKEGSRGLFATPEALMRFLFRRRTPCIPDK